MAQVLLQVVSALQGLAVHGLVHHDLKPENVLLARLPQQANDPVDTRLADFGLVRRPVRWCRVAHKLFEPPLHTSSFVFARWAWVCLDGQSWHVFVGA